MASVCQPGGSPMPEAGPAAPASLGSADCSAAEWLLGLWPAEAGRGHERFWSSELLSVHVLRCARVCIRAPDYYCEQRKDGCKHARICRVSRDTYRQTLTAVRLGNREKREGRACALEKQGAPLGKLSKGQLWKERRFEERMDHIWGGGVSLLFEEIKFLRSLYKRSLQNVKFT